MFYKQNSDRELSRELFVNPSSEYRAVPFWAWNCRLERDVLLEQIGIFQEMGFGGFNMHPRKGLETVYLSPEYMGLVKDCVEEAQKKHMYAWLYDEDRWPSGFAGGLVTCDPEYRQRRLVFTQEEEESCGFDEAVKSGKPYLWECFDVLLDEYGKLISYRVLPLQETAVGTKWYAYVKTPEPTSQYNNQTYVDTMNPKAIDRFLQITHEKYYETVGEHFGKTCPAIFTDEPHHAYIKPLLFANGENDEAVFAWTMDFPESFKEVYGYELKHYFPELVWERADGTPSKVRYHYYDHIAERFACAFTDRIASWCQDHNIILTGHMLTEENLKLQTYRAGEVMRMYRRMALPGVDNLMNRMEYNTLKQCQSVVHQYGREAMLSELYGVTNWDFDFRGHKFQGDWQAALGVTVRMHHLSWVSMQGEAKRDYPASILHQSPWFKEYRYVEDHFARVNTAMTRGVPRCRLAVIHPMESFWLYCGTNEHTQLMREHLDERFKNLTEWLLLNLMDFDFISEALLPELYEEKDGRGYVGHMRYDAILVPALETIRGTTLEILKRMAAKGVRIIMAGKAPRLVDAEVSDRPAEFASACQIIDFDKLSILDAVEKERFLDIRTVNGERTKDLIYNLREDREDLWLFIAHAIYPKSVDIPLQTKATIVLNGEFQPECYDTISGQITPVSFEIKNGKTYIPYTIYQYDSILLHLKKTVQQRVEIEQSAFCGKKVDLPAAVEVVRHEPNVLVLDRAQYTLDNGELCGEEDILKIHDACRAALGYGKDNAQPWAKKRTGKNHTVTLQFIIQSSFNLEHALLALEKAQETRIFLNGVEVPNCPDGYFVDRAIQTVKLPPVRRGKNVLRISMPFGNESFLEACYLLGEFHVKVSGRETTLVRSQRKIGYGDIVPQGMPFYGGNLTYRTAFTLQKGGDLKICANYYRGAMLRVVLDGEDLGVIAYAPYTLQKENVPKGKHELTFTVYGNRVNTFGGLHNISGSPWYGPEYWRTEKYEWSYEYANLRKTGLLSSPMVEIQEKQ